MDHVAAVRRALGTARASLDCPCLACAADRLCVALEEYVWVRPGSAPPEGFVRTDTVSVWPDTGKVRAELWEKRQS